ncbi:MAG: MBL fold metallo-hydrolase [Candidatus Nanohaloarchaea archaeon]
MFEYNGLEVFWDGHASVRLKDNGFTVAVDPYSKVSEGFEADIVLVTHADSGHLDRDFLKEVCTGRTCVIVPESIEEELPCMDVERVSEGEVLDVYNVEIEAVPMKNAMRGHAEGVGYRFAMGDTVVYVAGDAGVMEEAHDLENKIDIAFLPVDGVYTMDQEEAVKMAVRIKPDVVVPYHYGEPFFEPGTSLKGFKSALEDRNIECRIIDRED